MALSPLRNDLSLNDEVDIRERSLFARLKRLFSSGAIVRNIGGKKLKVIDTDSTMYATDRNSNRERFNRVRSTGYNSYTRDFALSYQAARIDLFRDYDTMDMDPILSCLSGDTYVSTLNGNYTMEELCKMYPDGQTFEVWSWDNEKCNYTIGNAHHPRKTGKKKIIELVFDNDEILKCTENHRVLLLDGTYKQAKDIKSGESVLPFLYRNEEYMKIKSKGKYKKAHRFIYEDIFEKNIYNRAIHHINHNKYDNRTCNLQEMSISEHALYHKKSKITSDRKKKAWTLEMRKRKSEEVKKRFDDPSYKEKFSRKMKKTMSDVFLRSKISNSIAKKWKDEEYARKSLSGWKTWQSSCEGKKFMSKHSSKLNKDRWKNDLKYREKMTQIFSDHAKELWKTSGFKEKFVQKRLENLRIKMANDPEYSKNKYGRSGEENNNFNDSITNEYLLTEGLKYNTLVEFSRNIKIPRCNTDRSKTQFIKRRLVQCGYSSFLDYKKKHSYSNHKLIKIIDREETVDVYDLTVDYFENFCLKSGIVVSNSGLDVYSDECLVANEMGEILTVRSDDSNIKDILYNLYYDILNIQFNLWSWTRNLCKYGDMFIRLYISPTYGVYFVEPISPYNVERIENSDPMNKNYVKFQIRPTDTSQAETLEEFEMVHFRLLGDSNWIPYGKGMLEGARRVWKQLCLHENSEIWTPDGFCQIKNIKKGDIVYSYDVNNCRTVSTKVINCLKTGVKNTFEVKTSHRKVRLTSDHKILLKSKNGDYEYKSIESIPHDKPKNHFLVLPTINSNKNHHKISMSGENYYCKLNNIGIEFARKISEIGGIINKIKEAVGDAHPYKQVHAFFMGTRSVPYNVFLILKEKFGLENRMVDFHIKNSKNKTLTSENFEFILDKQFIRFLGFMLGDGWNTRVGIGFSLSPHSEINQRYMNVMDSMGIHYEIFYPKNQPSHPGSVIVFNKELKMIMSEAGFITGFKNKEIPPWVFGLSMEMKKEFIKGLFDADGSWKWGVIGLSNKKLIDQLKNLCQQSGIMCNDVKTCQSEVETDEHGVTRQPTYKLYINFNKEYDLYFEQITSITPFEDKSSVYDIQVESDLHNFIADGVVVHNCLLEDSMLIHRIMRAPEKRIFKIDVGNTPPNEVDALMEKITAKMKKVPYIDQRTGDYNLRFNLQNMVEDFFLPVRGSDSGNSIENLSGLEWTGIDDVEYVRNKMMAALKIPKSFLGYDSEISGKATLACVVPETKIPLLNGKTKTINELIKDYEDGIKNYVYSMNETTHEIVPGEIEWAGYTRKNAELVRVYLDNEEYIDCTPDHLFMKRDGNWIEAQNLKSGQSLMPLYRENKYLYKKSDYEKVYNPGTNKYEWTHRLVDRHINGELKQPHKLNNTKFKIKEMIVIHHEDFNRLNNSPDNLRRLSFAEHGVIHQENAYKTICSPEANAYKKTPEFRKKKSKERLEYLKSHPNVIKKLKKNLAQYNFTNEELSVLCKKKWDKDDGSRKKRLSECNIKYNKIEKMQSVAREKRGFLNPLPTFGDLVRFSKENGYNTNKAKKNLECSTKYIHKLIYENGYKSVNDFSKEYNIKNHKVIKVELLSQKRDTCDITIKNYHNFATDAGVIIHNSEDVRFARTIGRIQNFIISGLGQIGRVHLYAQGYRDEDLVNFSLELTNPSLIFEKEKIDMWSEKLDVAKNAMESKIFSRDWIYHHLFDISEEDIELLSKQIAEDSKQLYRYKSIEEDGNDPAMPFKKIKQGGEEGGEEMGGGPPEIGGGPEEPPGAPGGGEGSDLENALKEGHGEPADDYVRPSQEGEKDASDYPFGEDPIGDKEIHEKPRKSSNLTHSWKGNTPFSLGSLEEGKNFKITEQVLRTRSDSILTRLDDFLKNSPRELLVESVNEPESSGSLSLLSEDNIIE